MDFPVIAPAIARTTTGPLSFRPYKIIATVKGHPDIEQVEGLIRANRNSTSSVLDRETEVEFLLERETSARAAVLRAFAVLELFVVKDVFVQAVNLAGK
ncbi:hypothetical protein [Tsukamurella tyrosinosolvens]|uniref:hypothetical protein n=1 Tax=Tsukamurella tyrosinosolvens TaxID=57704 RepID=UPI0034618936